MASTKQLQPETVYFIGGETAQVYQHNGGLILLDASERPGAGFGEFRRHMVERLAHLPQMRWKLHQVPMGLDLPYWVEDENFSFDHHIRRIAVPSPGDDNALSELVSYLYSKHMDRDRPLWEAWFIEGLQSGQYAVFQKLHHCLMDGQGASQLAQVISDFEPDAPPRPLPRTLADAKPGVVPTQWEQSFTAAKKLYSLPLRLGRSLARDMLPGLLKKGLGGKGKSKAHTPVPLAPFNRVISSYRGFVFGSLSLEDIKAIKNHFKVTLNDVVLALVSTSLREYLLERDGLPKDSLYTQIAISLRREDDEELSNRITSAGVTLATDIADPVKRLQKIAQDAQTQKEKGRKGKSNNRTMEYAQMLPPFVMNVLMNFAPPEKTVVMAKANLLVSNVRGSDKPLYMGGMRQTAMYPMTIIGPGMGINFTCVSYVDHIDFGITIEPELVPEPQQLVEGLHAALALYKNLCKPTQRKPRKSVARKKAPARVRKLSSKPKKNNEPKSSQAQKSSRSKKSGVSGEAEKQS